MNDHARKSVPQDAGTGAVSLPETALRSVVPGLDSAEGGNLDNIRDILFGAQSRELEQRIGRLEERLAKDTADLRDDIKRRFAALELYARKELEALADRLKVEQAERANGVSGVTQALADAAKSLERQITQLDEQSAKGQRDLREQILEQSKTLAEDIRRTCESLSAALDRAVDALRHDKADRATVATLLSEMAMRLSSDPTPPAGRS